MNSKVQIRSKFIRRYASIGQRPARVFDDARAIFGLGMAARASRLIIIALLASLIVAAPVRAQDRFEPITLGLVELLCKNPTHKFQCYQLDSDQCEYISSPLIDRCVTKYIRSKPLDSLVAQSAMQQLSRDLHLCIKSEFASAFGQKKLATKECEDA